VWLVLVLPCTFSEPIGLELRTTSGDLYLHAQLFTGFMFIAAAACAWFLRAWKVGELENVKVREEQKEAEIRHDTVSRESELQRHTSRMSSLKAAKGLWCLQRV